MLHSWYPSPPSKAYSVTLICRCGRRWTTSIAFCSYSDTFLANNWAFQILCFSEFPCLCFSRCVCEALQQRRFNEVDRVTGYYVMQAWSWSKWREGRYCWSKNKICLSAAIDHLRRHISFCFRFLTCSSSQPSLSLVFFFFG